MGQRFSKEATLLAPSMEGNLEEVKHLVGKQIAASKRNDADALRAFTNLTDDAGNCAIHGAVFSGHLDVVEFLAESCGADLTMKNGLGCSPIWIASGYNHLCCLEYLMKKLVSKSNGDDSYCLRSILLDANNTGDSPFLAAASRGNVEICEFILSSVEDGTKCKLLRCDNKTGDTPLKVAVAGGHESTVKLLLEAEEASTKSNNPEEEMYCVNRKNNLGLSPLIVACERNLPSIVDLLIQFKATNITIRDNKGRHALAVASFCGCEDVVTFLLSHMKQSTAVASLIDEKDSAGCTALWLAARTGNLKMVQLLIDAGADESITDHEGLSPQDVAVKFNKDAVNKYFRNRSIKS